MPKQEATQLAGSERLPGTRCEARRRSLRRALQIECSLESDSWDGPVVLSATDVSDEGLWVETCLALDRGAELVVSFPVPGQPEADRIWAVAEVARVGIWRRKHDAHPSGMGLAITYCSERDRQRLRAALRGLPPQLPRIMRAQPPPLPGTVSEVSPQELPAVLDWLLASE